MRYRFFFFSMFFFTMILCRLTGQSWDFVREKDGIKLFTRSEPGKPVKAFRGVAEINAPAAKIFDVLKDLNDIAWWDKNVTLNKVLFYEKNKGGRYYLVYDLPWPVPDRDLCVDVSVVASRLPGERRISAVAIDGIIPERKDMVRIKDYRQTWMVRPVDETLTHVELEGLVDPGGSIPDWITNMLIIDSPYKSLSGLRKRMMHD